MDYENMDKKTLIKILRHKDDMLKKLCLEKEKLDYYASTDAMTGVLNRRSGLKLLGKGLNLSKINDRDMVVCFIDIDRLKIINDTFGHEEGDKLLINVARILKESIRKTDFVIRMGGDEFLVVFPETTMKEVNKIWHRIYVKIEEINKNSSKYNLNLSCGFYEYKKERQSEMTVSDLIKNADFKMYKKKLSKKEEFDDRCINNINK
ncbi:GGDEF domain-containing protein [Clostridium autoethanogenum]|uniref:GGDEF domain-containing protein n=1 Tax=Clostridium autoethanogenum TaxID=84023 RepID=A0A3M0S3Y3_9CLOT|nr:GGDEF domain-containing protein [Clostridium autoethanogenum]RMC93025.1 GGDEF domain-containing protein [Clostridium autoethanogenum]